MKADKKVVPPDREDFDGEEAEIFGAEAAVDPIDQVVSAVVDEDLIDAELGELDLPITEVLDADGLDDEIVDPIEPEDEDDQELTMLQELGIDLDSYDDDLVAVDLGVGLVDDETGDDEAAA